MKSDEKLWTICEDIYRELYSEATPSADFDQLKEGKLHKEKGGDDPHPYKDYFLQEERQREIVEKHCDENNLSEIERSKVRTEVYLGVSPVGTKTAWRGEEE